MEPITPPITPYSMPTQHECCSRKIRGSFVPLRNIEEGVRTIQEILMRDPLCFHDVDQMNQIYRQIDLLERQVEQIPTCNSQYALNKIIERIISSVKDFGKDPVKDAKSLVSLYYLKNFSDKNLPIENRFDSLFGKCKANPQTMRNIAEVLPICGSEAQFEADIKSLINRNSDDVAKILDQKRKTVQDYTKTTEIIKNKRLELEKWRKSNPKDFPDYFDELLDGGYLHLYDHLIEMRALGTRNDRQFAIEKKTFSLLSHIVLQTRQAIIEKVESSISNDCRNVLFLLGDTGAGKSTTFCFLRGDEMVLKGSHYESKSDKNCLIGHSQKTSCTFFPSVGVVNEWVIVDFPGFNDSNGPLFSLGMECALKALVAMYQPKILVVESIINKARSTTAANLGSRLERLLGNKGKCILGITQYSEVYDFAEIRRIEEDQKKEALAPTAEETRLTVEIEMASKYNAPNNTIQEMRQKLAKMQEEKAQHLQDPLPETEEKVKSRQNLQKRENEMLEEIGLAKIIRFDDLKNSTCLPLCFTKLSQAESIFVNPKHLLDADHGKLIEHLFENDLVRKMMETVEYDFKFDDFEQSVKESSLIYTIFSRSNPEVGEFLHLPEIDPSIVRNYDKKIVGDCIDKYMRSIILKLDISFIKVSLKQMKGKADTQLISDLESKFIRLKKYVMGLLGIKLSGNENSEQIEAKWVDIRKDIATAITAVEKDYSLPTWANVLMGLPLGIPLGIYTLRKWSAQERVERGALEKIIANSSKELEQMYDTLLNLKDLEKLIQKRENLDQAFESVQISLESQEDLMSTMKEKISKVRLVYEGEDWDRRVAFLAEGVQFIRIDKFVVAYHCLESPSGKLVDTFKKLKTIPFHRGGSYEDDVYIGYYHRRFNGDMELDKFQEKHKISYGKVNQVMAAAALLYGMTPMKKEPISNGGSECGGCGGR